MAVACELEDALTDTILMPMPAGIAAGDALVVVASCAGENLDVLTSNAPWLVAQASEIIDALSARFAVLVGIVPDPVPASVQFVCVNAQIWSVISKAFENVNTVTPVADLDTFADLDGGLTNSISVGPVNIGDDDARLVYCVAAYLPAQVQFEAGPAPAIASQQFGRTVAINSPLETGIWSEPANTGASAVYTQELIPSGIFTDVNCLAVLLSLSPQCGVGVV